MTPETYRDALKLAVSNLPRPVRFRAENAFVGFDKARRLLEIDREMASFRAITAEEEAAAALFRSLQLQGYPGADKLSLRDHRQKAVVGPFIQAVKVAIANRRTFNLQMTLDWRKPEITVRLPLSELGVQFEGSEEIALQMVEPLGNLAVKGGGHPADFFDDGLKKVVEGSGYKALDRLISKEANLRNTVLYASDTALPVSKLTEAGIAARQHRAEIALGLCVAILQTPNHQSLAKQALQAFLRSVGRPADELFDYGERPVEVDIRLKDDGPSDVIFTPATELPPQLPEGPDCREPCPER